MSGARGGGDGVSERGRDDVGERPARSLSWQQRRAAFRAAAAAAGTEQSYCSVGTGGARSPSRLVDLFASDERALPPYRRGASAVFSHAIRIDGRVV